MERIPCTIYIDESGDLGAHRGTKWFVLTAVIVDKAEEASLRQTIRHIKGRLNIQEIHFKNIRNFYQKAYIASEIAGKNFTYMNVLFDTDKYDTSKIPSPLMAYNFICKYLLQRASWYMRDTGRIGDIVLSSRGTSRDRELMDYITDKLLPYPANGIDSSVFGEICAKTAPTWDMLQLADVCATTTYNAYEENDYGFVTPCFSMLLKSNLYQKNGSALSYGIKYFSREMTPDTKELEAKRVCKKRGTPSATST